MRFFQKKRRQPPAIIIINLIDILLVLLIFLMVTTTFKQMPAVRLALPESKLAVQGATATNVIITVTKQAPFLYLGIQEVTPELLETELLRRAALNPQVGLTIQADADAPFSQIIKVMDAAKAANIKTVSALTRTPAR
ncbi:MAG TPA: biopolymer transporter ExbD [Candidatus Paceibacterota bacterium]|nr:biopolymer transporter ExbD [Verrucomicrobiota bacterium]HRY51813.1 biopolymer transporter ExbD [Candidatus Paceibacterota bacterium]HSA02865.1 biopolymer transporter ExbD [Candidatus Paceibacterota bacterium]